jgi:hypothetical protein
MVSERDSKLASVRAVSAEMTRARTLARDLVERLERIERRFSADDEHAEVVAS